MPETKTTTKSVATPMMRQYRAVKDRYPDHIVFFRMGDFYEMFGDDAIEGAELLGITLTKRPHGKNGSIPLAGVPHHQAERYLAMLAQAGKRVVVCEQVEDPKLAKGIVKRDVTEIITPGTVMNPGALEDTESPSLAVIAGPDQQGRFGVASAEPSTGQFAIEDFSPQDLIDYLSSHSLTEIIIADDADQRLRDLLDGRYPVTPRPSWQFELTEAWRILKDHYFVDDPSVVGFDRASVSSVAAGVLLSYLRETKRARMTHINRVERLSQSDTSQLDPQTAMHLDVFTDLKNGPPTLVDVLDRCRTSMGRRLLRRRLTTPLTDIAAIEHRLDQVSLLVNDRARLAKITDALKGVFDVERFNGRLGGERIGPRDLIGLRYALHRWPELVNHVSGTVLAHPDSDPTVPATEQLYNELQRALVDDPPLVHTTGGIFRRGYSDTLDQLHDGAKDAKAWIAALQGKLRNDTGIPSLKVGYNKVFDYYIEVPKTHTDKIPDDWVRKQTLVSAERYITAELKEKEEIVLAADERAAELEAQMFLEVRARLTVSMDLLVAFANAIARIDVTVSLAKTALAQGYERPILTIERTLMIRSGRHPVLETINPAGGFVPNDTDFSDESGWLHLLTGPNMAGKSTYLRQVGLIVLLAQIGSYVPADSATIGIVDRIFTRVGADDDLTRNRSTFMVEMAETARILRGMTARSLVLFDEVGRGTSTYDGVAIAWAIGEHLSISSGGCPRTLFATHYHELTALADRQPGVVNHHLTVREKEGKVAFLFRVHPGPCDDSFGIHVAQLAGVPKSVVTRARDILTALETGTFDPIRGRAAAVRAKAKADATQANLFAEHHKRALEQLGSLTPETMTPIEALNTLAELARELQSTQK